MTYLHPGALSYSEFARQSSGVYLHGTCVETSTDDIGVMLGKLQIPPNAFGDYLKMQVQAEIAHDPSVSPDGSSNYNDAVWWMQSQWGLTCDANIAGTVEDSYNEMLRGLPLGYLYLIGTCNAQMLPGDEHGVLCHGLVACGVDNNNNLICADPDNAATQINMPGNPVGNLVTYSLANFQAAGISSLTRVHPVSTPYDGYFTPVSADDWTCNVNGFHLSNAILHYWQAIGGLPGLPIEKPQYGLAPGHPEVCSQHCERGRIWYDPNNVVDTPPARALGCYLGHVEDNPPAPAPHVLKVDGITQMPPYNLDISYR